MTTYRSALIDAMSLLAEDPKAIFLGQSVGAGGTAMAGTLQHVPIERRMEMPVFENTQMGLSIGLALAGWLPVSIYPRINFLLEAFGQLVQHLDKLPQFGNGYNPRVIIRTTIATDYPLDPGPQHLGDYAYSLRMMLRDIRVVKLEETRSIIPAYQKAMRRDRSTILIEYLGMYDN